MKILLSAIVGLFISFSAHAGDGMPLPWPFPWAEDCPIDWMNLEGRYLLSDTANEQEVQLTIRLINHFGFRMIRVSRHSKNGELMAEGFNFINMAQREISLQMFPIDHTEAPVSAKIKLYYQSFTRTCGAKNLVPILSMEKQGSAASEVIQYRMVRIE